MTTGLSLENLAKILHADKQQAFAEECFARQVELAQSHTSGTARGFSWGASIKRMGSRHLVVTLAIHPLQLTMQWI